MSKSLSFKGLLKWSVERLFKAGIKNPRLEGELLLAHGLNCSRTRLLTFSDFTVNKDVFQDCYEMVKRRAQGEPVSYILGRREFWSRNFNVCPSVLIPRPESEFIIQCFLDLYTERKNKEPIRILDIGCGSGNLITTAVLEIPESSAVAIDVSPIALKVAKENASIHNVNDRIKFVQGNIFDTKFCRQLGVFDFILSNPPYIPSWQISTLMPEVKDHEPRQALDGGPEGLDFYKKIIPASRELLNDRGHLLLEIGDGQYRTVWKMMNRCFDVNKLTLDYTDIPRVILGRKVPGG